MNVEIVVQIKFECKNCRSYFKRTLFCVYLGSDKIDLRQVDTSPITSDYTKMQIDILL